MMTSSERQKLEALRTYAKTFDIKRFCFDKQIKFIEDPSPFKLALCSRRAGKTVACAADLTRISLSKPRQTSLYITLSRNNAKKIVWGDLISINRHYGLGAQTNETELSLRFPNDSVIYLSGAKDKTEIEKFRGLALSLCYIDEAQSFRSYIQELVDDVISKALFDHNGSLCLTGTPAPVPSGYFHDCFSSQEWSVHQWTMFDNPWIHKKSGKTPQELLERELKRKGVTVDDPSIQREVFGKWSVDIDALVFKYSQSRNAYQSMPNTGPGWHYIVGVDIGFEDSDAIAVLGYHEHDKRCYLIDEIVRPKQSITELAAQIQTIVNKYNPDSIVADTGGLGKKIAEEIQKRHGIPIRAAEKTRKFEYIELLNDALRTARFLCKDNSKFAQDCMLVEWDKDSTQPKVSDRYHSDICDAVLYAYRESLHWLSEPEEVVPLHGSDAWFKREEERLESEAIKAMQRARNSGVEEHLSAEYLSEDKDWD